MSAIDSTSRTIRLDRSLAVVGAIAVLAGIVVAIFHQSYAAVWELWKLSTYQYAFVVVPAAAYFLWQRRAALARQTPAPSWPAMLLLFAMAMAWQVGRTTALQAVEHTAAILAVPAIVIAVMGRNVLRASAFPFVLLATTIPVGEAVTPLLMVVTADIAAGLLQLFGVPFTRDGQYMSLAGGDFKVADVCAGTRYLLAGMTLALIFGYRIFATVRARVWLVLAAAALLVLGNGVRAWIVMIVASATELRYFAGRDHVIFGTIFFAVLLVVIFWVASRIADRSADESHREASGHATRTDARELPAIQPGRLSGASIMAVLLLMSGPAIHAYRSNVPTTLQGNLQLPTLSGCNAPGEWRGGAVPQIHGDGVQLHASYGCGAIDIHVLMVAYANQTSGSELVGSGNTIVPREWWEGGANMRTESVAGEARTHAVREVVLPSQPNSMLAWYWYDVNGSATVSEYGVKMREALFALMLRPIESRAYVIRVVGPSASLDEIRARARQAASAMSDAGSYTAQGGS